MKKIILIAGIFAVGSVLAVQADTIADWTFETSLPATAGPFSPEVGSGSASGSHTSGAAVYSSPSGDGSAKSYSANTWTANDYYEFQVSTIGYTNVMLNFDQISSSTGPGNFSLAYSTDGSSFTTFTSYAVIANSAPNAWSTTVFSGASAYTDDLSSVTAIANQSTVYFKLVDANGMTPSGGTVATAGTDRVDNFTVLGTSLAVPEPGSMALAAVGGLACLVARRRRS